jgi:hypothetical protein
LVVLLELLAAVRVYIVSTGGDTINVPTGHTVPIPRSIETDVAPVTSHCRVEVFPALIVRGLKEKSLMTGGPATTTVIMDDAVVEPALLVATRL